MWQCPISSWKNAVLIALFCYREEVYVIEGANGATVIDNVIVIDDVTVLDDVILESAEDSGSHVELIPLDTRSDFSLWMISDCSPKNSHPNYQCKEIEIGKKDKFSIFKYANLKLLN